jgi:heptosyltransferase III
MSKKLALFLKTKHIGDSIILTSAIEALPSDFMVDVLCFKDSEAVFKMHPKVRYIYVVPRFLKGFAKLKFYIQMYRQILNESYDLVAQFSDDWRGAFLARLLNSKLSVARNATKRPNFWKNSFHYLSKVPIKSRHAAEQDVDLLRRINLYSKPHAPAYYLKPDVASCQKVDDWLSGIGVNLEKIILVHAAARWKFKGISNLIWVQVINRLHQEGYHVILSGGPSDQMFNQSIIVDLEMPPILASNFSLEMTAALMKRARLLISIDSMAIHMASAMQLPVVALFGPTDDQVWSPWAVSSSVLALSAEDSPSFTCRPCGLDGCAGSKISQCLHAIPSSKIIKAAFDLLSKKSA